MIKKQLLIELNCDYCKIAFERRASVHARRMRNNPGGPTYCERKCFDLASRRIRNVVCLQCGKNFQKGNANSLRSPNHFCGRSCAALYNNTHKTHGIRRSKLEIWLENKLSELYPNLEILYNNKEAINSELDIYIPSLKLAFELNGIFHYEPIFGDDKLEKIQNNDNRKFQACYENKIALCIIDSSKLVYMKDSNAQKYLDIITTIINESPAGPQPTMQPIH